MKQAKLFAVAAIAALMTACSNGSATPPPMPSQHATSDENNDFALGLARGWFSPACATAGDDEARCFAYVLTDAGRAALAAREAASGERSISATTVSGYGPAQLQSAYNLSSSIGGGAGRTVAKDAKGS